MNHATRSKNSVLHLSRPAFALGAAAVLLIYTAALRYLQHFAILKALHDFWPPLVVLALFLAGWGALNLPSLRVREAWKTDANRICLPLGVFLILYTAYHHFGCWLGWVVTQPQTYWDQLAFSFLHGKLYLEAPTYFHDLTLFHDRWYVPQPPLPGLLMVPLTLLSGPVNAVRFSIFFAALNGLLVFLILQQAERLGWIALPRSGQLWLTALFAFGTPHLYVGMNGQVWFLSQVLTVTFSALAVYTAMKHLPGWLTGLCLAAAVLARPNLAMLWPMLLGIYITFLLEIQPTSGPSHCPTAARNARGGELNFTEFLGALGAQKLQKKEFPALEGGGGVKIARLRPAIFWSIQSALPVVLAAGGLLVYNQMRFGSWFDFGYVTINGAEQIVHDAQTYGIFSLHFIPRNLYAMFGILPRLVDQFPYILPTRDGINLWLTTPALLYLARRQSLPIWKIGTMLSIFLLFSLLVLYHNTGAFQFGYRYLLDFAVPLWLLLAAGLGRKMPRLFPAAVLLSIAINLLGTIWFAFNW